MKKNNLELLLKDGFSEKFAKFYLNILEEEKNNKAFDRDFVEWAHERGFRAEVASLYDINDSNYQDFLSDYDYYRIWPLNNWTRIWINDKMTLKYMLANTNYGDFMPQYYYYTSPNGLRALLDNPYNDQEADAKQFMKLLSEVKEFACKPCNGSTSVGFFKMTYKSGKFYADNKEILEKDFEHFLVCNPNYVFTEYLKPAGILKEISPQIHTLRIVTVNQNGSSPQMIGGYLRIPNDLSVSANYISLEDNSDKFNIVTDINTETGEFFDAKKVYINRKEDISVHPNSKVKLSGKIKNYDLLYDTVIGIAKRFNNIEYMGFDIGVSEDGFKCMEINTHPGIGHMQMYRSLFNDSFTEAYYKSKIEKLNCLSQEDKLIRNKIVR